MKAKRELIRVVRSPEGVVSIDPTGKKAGRGAYVCPDPECLRKAIKSRALERAFLAPVGPELVGELEALLQERRTESDG